VLLTCGRGRRTAWLNQVRGVPLADVFFVMFAIAFFVSRLIYYPRYLLWTIWYVDALRRLQAAGPAATAATKTDMCYVVHYVYCRITQGGGDYGMHFLYGRLVLLVAAADPAGDAHLLDGPGTHLPPRLPQRVG